MPISISLQLYTSPYNPLLREPPRRNLAPLPLCFTISHAHCSRGAGPLRWRGSTGVGGKRHRRNMGHLSPTLRVYLVWTGRSGKLRFWTMSLAQWCIPYVTNWPIDWPVDWLFLYAVFKQTNRQNGWLSIFKPTNERTKERMNERTNERTNEPTNQPTNKPTNQTTNQPINTQTHTQRIALYVLDVRSYFHFVSVFLSVHNLCNATSFNKMKWLSRIHEKLVRPTTASVLKSS